MASYRLLEDHAVAGQVLAAGSQQSTADVGGILPVGWPPTPNVDPLDTAAVNAFYAQGPSRAGLIRQLLIFGGVLKPVTYWTSPSDNVWTLTGLGINLAPVVASPLLSG